jgi:putative membrane protein
MKALYLAAAFVALALPAYGQATQGQPAQKGAQAVDSNTRQFVEKAAIGDMYEIQSSKIALDKSQSDEVEELADMIIDDHTDASEKLKSIVSDLQGLQLPTQLDQKHQEMIKQLQSADGGKFHQLYRKQQLEAHQTAIQLFEGYSKNGQNNELKQFAGATLPTLKEHLKMVQDLPEQMQGQQVGQTGQQKGQPQAQTRSQQAQTEVDRAQRQPQQARTGAQGKMQVIAQPGPNHILSSDLTGATVYGANNENIGDISDVVLDREGNVVAVIVGVGGFLGIGEKSVAIPFDALEIAAAGEGQDTQDRTGSAGDRQGQNAQKGAQPMPRSTKSAKGTVEPQRVVLRGMTREDLEKAPAFDDDEDDSNQDRAKRNQDRNQNNRKN